MISRQDGERIRNDAFIAIDALESIAECWETLHPNYLKEKCETAQKCLDFMKSFYLEEDK